MSHHHWLPQGLLGNFTLSGRKSDLLWRFNLLAGTFDEVRVKDVCYIDDLHRLDSQSLHRARSQGLALGPDGLEKMFGRDVERHALAAIRSASTNGYPARPEDLNWLISYLAFQIVRTPYYLAQLQEHHGVRRPNELLAMALGDQPPFFERLKDRRWTMWKIRRGGSYFWISDDPVSVSLESGQPLDVSLSNLERQDSVVHMPLTKRLAFVGSYSGCHAKTYDVDDSEFIGFLNALSLRGGCTELFGPTRPVVVRRNGVILTLDEIVDSEWQSA